MIYIIEHLEPELYEWCLIEYENISNLVGKNNLWFTNIKENDIKKLDKFGKVFTNSVKTLNLKNVCILDPEAEKLLETNDKFDYYIFGGILGDYPPKKRTKKELTKFLSGETRHIGKKQFSTDNAVFTVKKILDGSKFSDLKFKDKVGIKINKIESVILPFRYNLVNDKPFMSSKIVDYLKKKKSF